MDIWYTENHTDHVRMSMRVDKQLASVQSDFQRIDIFESVEFGRIM
ncbi:MAG: spermidine synthase, partial [Ruminococcus sp.]